MAVKKTIEIEATTDDAVKELKQLRKEVDNLNNTVVDNNKKLENSLENVEKTGRSVTGTLKTIGKATGVVFLVAEALAVIKDLFTSNQKVLDFFNTSFEFLSIAFNDFVNFITK